VGFNIINQAGTLEFHAIRQGFKTGLGMTKDKNNKNK